MAGGVKDLVLMLLSPLAALAVYLLVSPLNQTAGLAAGIALMLGLAVARRPAGA